MVAEHKTMTSGLTIRKSYTIEEVMEWLNECNVVGIEPDMARQLLSTMQREAKLRESLRFYTINNDDGRRARIALRSEYSVGEIKE